MIATILQPTYLPWLGYFDMIARSDAYIAFDHAQFARRSWQQRNRILMGGKPHWLSMPVKSDKTLDVRVRDKVIDDRKPWRKKHLRTIGQTYAKAPFRHTVMPVLELLTDTSLSTVADLNVALIKGFIELLGLDVEIIRSSSKIDRDPDAMSTSDRLLNLCKLFDIHHLHEGAAGAAFVELETFAAEGVHVAIQSFEHPVYPQLGNGEFESHLSIVDVLMNIGPEQTRALLGSKEEV